MPTQWSEAEQVPLGCIAPYAAALPWHISPSVMAEGYDTSLAEGGEGVPRLRARRGHSCWVGRRV